MKVVTVSGVMAVNAIISQEIITKIGGRGLDYINICKLK